MPRLSERTATGQGQERPTAEPEDLDSGPGHPEATPQQQSKEVLEMAASLFIEEESGSYTARFQHPHNGYYAGDFSQTPLVRSRLSFAVPGQVVHRREPAGSVAREA
jgi:hypothetical protein